MAAGGVDTQPADPAGHYQPHVSLGLPVLGDGGAHEFGELVPTHGERQVNGPRRQLQPAEVVFEIDEPSADHPHAFEDPVAVQKAVVEHRDRRLLGSDDATLHPDFHVSSTPEIARDRAFETFCVARISCRSPSWRSRALEQATATDATNRSPQNTGAATAANPSYHSSTESPQRSWRACSTRRSNLA